MNQQTNSTGWQELVSFSESMARTTQARIDALGEHCAHERTAWERQANICRNAEFECLRGDL